MSVQRKVLVMNSSGINQIIEWLIDTSVSQKRFLFMHRHTIRLILCGILLVSAACASQSPSAPLVPPSAQVIVSKTDAYLNKLTKRNDFSGSVLIARNGEILVSNGYGKANREKDTPNTAQTKFRLASVTKQFTAMAILILQAQGKLDVQDPISKYLPDCPAAWQNITVHHLLTHTSGIPNFTNLPDYQTTKGLPATPLEIIARFKDKPLDFQAGEKWSYSNSGYVVLGFIIEKVSGKTYEAFLQKNIFVPLRMADSGYDHNNTDLATGYVNQSNKPADFLDMSIPYAAGGLYSSVEDLNRWQQALYTEQLISVELLDNMFTPFAPMPDSDGLGYGYGWVIGKEGGHPVVGHISGIEGFTTAITCYPDDKVAIIVLGNQENVGVYDISVHLAKIVFGYK